ncbi:TfuA-like protein [uncultured Roseobacter sp.]|uniref:TfuA-like protein n=1 Tax=uncultured Roseobacter sp. TaxID=114847 RepID=UPI002614014A|nr:TfuA-like protein [uncultured Roseobacter sp.]
MIVFAGPSLAGLQPADWPDMEFRPPVRQGDLFLAACERPAAIGVIDGYFEGVPAVWHKEILWALSRGIRVFGASSMGALRAAELDVFGMKGVGRIYEDYRDLVCTDDDEVALLHGPAELGYPVLSLAMVNLRASLHAAVAEKIIDAAGASLIAATGKSQHYKTRTWKTVLDAVPPEVPERQLAALHDWSRLHAVDQKCADAQAMLELMTHFPLHDTASEFHFERTDLWVQATETWRKRSAQADTGGGYNLFKDKSFIDR